MSGSVRTIWLSGLGPLYNKLGMDIVWQSVATFSTAISTFGLCVMVNQFDNNQVLAVRCSWPILYVFDAWLTDLSKYLHCVNVEHYFCHLRVIILGCSLQLAYPACCTRYFITWKGSEYIMTKQFWKFQGLVREGGYATVVMALCIGYLYTGQFSTCVDGMTNDEDRDDVRMHLCMFAKHSQKADVLCYSGRRPCRFAGRDNHGLCNI